MILNNFHCFIVTKHFLNFKKRLIMKNNQIQQTNSFLSDDVYLEEIRKQMIRFATLQLGDSHSVEDAVQDALIGA